MSSKRTAPQRRRPASADLGAIQKNWRFLQAKVGKSVQCAAVVKADGYGLGAAPVAKALAAEGCKTFFVATLEEGLALRDTLKSAEIVVLNGLLPRTESEILRARLIPVLNDLGQLDTWRRLILPLKQRPAAMLHLDTGLSRLGLSRGEIQVLLGEPDRLAGVSLRAIIS